MCLAQEILFAKLRVVLVRLRFFLIGEMRFFLPIRALKRVKAEKHAFQVPAKAAELHEETEMVLFVQKGDEI